MKTYLCFNYDGEIIEKKINYKNQNDLINSEINKNYINYILINFKKFNYLLFYNNYNINNNNIKNLCNIPFINFDIYGQYIIFKIDENENIINFTLNQLLKLININVSNNILHEYSSDDFD